MPQTILAIYEPTTIAHNFYRHAPNVLPIPSRHDAKILHVGKPDFMLLHIKAVVCWHAWSSCDYIAGKLQLSIATTASSITFPSYYR